MSYAEKATKWMNKYPAIEDLQRKAHQRMPLVAKEYLETGTDHDDALHHNVVALRNIKFKPHFLKGALSPDISTDFLGNTYSAPIGMAPIGLTGLMWPNVELHLAEASIRNKIPFCLSTLATETPERVGPHLSGQGWFQLYTPREESLARTLMDRAKASGFDTLVITVDIPTPSRRQRTKRAGLQTPPKITPRFLWQGITHPSWSMATLKRGIPRLRTIESYSGFKDMMSVEKFAGDQLGGNLTWDYVKRLQDYWKGPTILKGIMHEEDARQATEMGVDAIVISNHGARQFDGVVSPVDILPDVVNVVQGKTKIIMDSGIRSGLDVIRAMALGADFVLLGRAWIYGVAALGKYGADHTYNIITGELKNNMVQLGISSLDDIKKLQPIKF